MKFIIRHEIKGRIRIHLCQNHMTMRQADLLAWFLSNQPMVEEAKVYERTADAVIHFRGERKELIRAILDFTYEDETLNEIVPMDSGPGTESGISGQTGKPVSGTSVYQTVSSGSGACSLYHHQSYPLCMEGDPLSDEV